MSIDEIRLDSPELKRWNWLRPVLLMAVPLAVVWAIAFAITGLLWWGASEDVEQVAPPAPPALESIDSSSVDLELYARAHPAWTP